MSDRRSSDIWKHFTKIDSINAKCDICKKNYSYKTSITNLKKHLSHSHLLYINSYTLEPEVILKPLYFFINY